MTQTLERAGLTFVCTDPIEAWRVETLLEKEPGTVAWIEAFEPWDVFYDVGANIGVYTLLAAKRDCLVYAWEPHPGNFKALKANVRANGMDSTVTATQLALSSFVGSSELYIKSDRAGSSGSQVGVARDEHGRDFSAVDKLQIETVCLDQYGDMSSSCADHIKIDVDGHELAILYGARDTLARGVKSVQVETHPAQRAALLHYMQAMGYRVQSVHYTQNGQKAIDKGADPSTVVSNTIFVPEGA